MIDSLDSAVCLSLTRHIHGNKFFNRKVYVTAVVQKTPDKVAEVEELEPCPNSLENSSGSDTSDESDVEQSSTASKPPCTKLFSSISATGKRAAKGSPEVSSETSKRDKKKNKQDSSSSTNLRSSSRQGKGGARK